MSLNTKDKPTPRPTNNDLTELLKGIALLGAMGAGARIDRTLSLTRAAEVDEQTDAGFDMCEDCGGPLDKRFARFCDCCRDVEGNRDELREDYLFNEADRLNDLAIEKELS